MTRFGFPPVWRWVLLIAAGLILCAWIHGLYMSAVAMTPAPLTTYSPMQLPETSAIP